MHPVCLCYQDNWQNLEFFKIGYTTVLYKLYFTQLFHGCEVWYGILSKQNKDVLE